MSKTMRVQKPVKEEETQQISMVKDVMDFQDKFSCKYSLRDEMITLELLKNVLNYLTIYQQQKEATIDI